jgi:hypothetical protein
MPDPITTEVLALTAADLQAYVQPCNESSTFLIGEDGEMSEAEAIGFLKMAEDMVLSRVPNRYRQLMRRVDGEVLVRRARGGETSASTGLAPVSGLELWKNWSAGRWDDREPEEALVSGVDYTIDEATGVVTLTTALERGDRLWAAYDHAAGARFPMLRDVALRIAAGRIASTRRFFVSADGSEPFERMESGAYLDLQNMVGVDALDRLELVGHETERDNWGPIMRLGVDD